MFPAIFEQPNRFDKEKKSIQNERILLFLTDSAQTDYTPTDSAEEKLGLTVFERSMLCFERTDSNLL